MNSKFGKVMLLAGMVMALSGSILVGCSDKAEETPTEASSETETSADNTAETEAENSTEEAVESETASEMKETEMSGDETVSEAAEESVEEVESLTDDDMLVSICWLEDYGKEADTCTWVTLDETDYQLHAVLQAKEEVTDLRIYRISMTDVDDDGNAVYDAEQVYQQDKLTETLPLGLDLSFPGDLPAYGISFVDSEGNEQEYAIGESGYDGSLFLTPAEF